jgi:hypothetical protein
MEEWWQREETIADGANLRGGYSKDLVEYRTGCIPLLLRECARGGKIDLRVQYLEEIYEQAMKFELSLKADGSDWDWYIMLARSFSRCH